MFTNLVSPYSKLEGRSSCLDTRPHQLPNEPRHWLREDTATLLLVPPCTAATDLESVALNPLTACDKFQATPPPNSLTRQFLCVSGCNSSILPREQHRVFCPVGQCMAPELFVRLDARRPLARTTGRHCMQQPTRAFSLSMQHEGQSCGN